MQKIKNYLENYGITFIAKTYIPETNFDQNTTGVW